MSSGNAAAEPQQVSTLLSSVQQCSWGRSGQVSGLGLILLVSYQNKYTAAHPLEVEARMKIENPTRCTAATADTNRLIEQSPRQREEEGEGHGDDGRDVTSLARNLIPPPPPQKTPPPPALSIFLSLLDDDDDDVDVELSCALSIEIVNSRRKRRRRERVKFGISIHIAAADKSSPLIQFSALCSGSGASLGLGLGHA